jgi:hypothetical protein
MNLNARYFILSPVRFKCVCKRGAESGIFVEALKAWNFYLEFSKCGDRQQDNECLNAQKQCDEIVKLMAQ